MEITRILKRPIISEKSMQAAKTGRYTFEVERKATKSEIKKAVESQFGVKVIAVYTLIQKGKSRRGGQRRIATSLSPFKKAVVQLAKEQKIDIFEVKE